MPLFAKQSSNNRKAFENQETGAPIFSYLRPSDGILATFG
jgi:hypothetical protein